MLEPNFNNCQLVNYVAGTEAWFQQFNATALVPQIKSMSDLFGASGLPKSFVTNQAHEGKFYQALAAQGEQSFFNFVAFNKSGSAQGLTNSPACGTVNITEGEATNKLNYRQPDGTNPVAQAYIAYANNPSQETQQALIATAMANGITFAADYSDVEEKITAYLTPLCAEHAMMRGLNDAGAPVFDFGSAFPLLGYDGVNSYLQTLQTIVAEQSGGAPAMYAATNEQKAAIPSHCAIYFNGMMLVMGLTPYVA